MTLQISIVPQLTPAAQPPARPRLWMHKEDKDISDSSWGGGIRPCASCPAVWVLKDDQHAIMDRQWQYFIRAINYNMTLEDAYLLLDWKLAFANETGFRKPGSPKADYFHDRDLDQKPPNLDKVRTCSRSLLTGTPGYSLATALKQTVSAVTDRARGRPTALAARPLRELLTATNVLKPVLFDSMQPPPLKPGRAYPAQIADVNPDDYLYMPQTHPWMFLTATIVNRAGECVQFPRGGLYPWTGDNTPRSWMPHVANLGYGVPAYPLTRLTEIPAEGPLPRPYRP